MRSNTIDHNTLTNLVDVGAVRGAQVVGQKGGWSVVVRCGMEDRPLAVERGSIRLFKRFETLVGYLMDIGIPKFDVNASGYHPDAPAGHKRPAQAKAMRALHQAAAYQQHFQAEVLSAMEEAKRPDAEWVSHQDVKLNTAKRRERYLGLAKRAAD